MLNEFPNELKEMKRWTYYKLIKKDDNKFTKPPCNKYGYNVDITNSDNLNTYDKLKLNNKVNGYSFVFANDGIIGIDLDDVIDSNGNYTKEALEVIETLDSYTELSVSGRGVHIYVKATLNQKQYRKGFIEIYQDKRAFTVSGKPINSIRTINERSKELELIYNKYIKTEEKVIVTPKLSSSEDYQSDLDYYNIGIEKSDSLQEYVCGSKRTGDESSSDLALMGKLAYWCNNNMSLMIEKFKDSGYYYQKDDKHKTKCQRPDYLVNTARKAFSNETAKQKNEEYLKMKTIDKNRSHENRSSKNATTIIDEKPSIVNTNVNIAPNKEVCNNLRVITSKTIIDKTDFLKFDKNNKVVGVNFERFIYEYYKEEITLLSVRVSYADNKQFHFFQYENGIYKRVGKDQMKAHLQIHLKKVLKKEDINYEYKSNHGKESLDILMGCLIGDATKIYTMDDFNKHENLICFKNGVLDLDEWIILPHDEKYLFTSQIPYNFDPNEEVNESKHFSKWFDYLTCNDTKKAQAILEYIGICISNINVSKTKKALFVVGSGNTGKSFIFKLLTDLVGAENTAINDLYTLDDKFATAKLHNARLLGNGDLKVDNSRIATPTLFKNITGGDSICYEQKFEVSFTFIYTGGIVYCSNAVPKLAGDKGDHVYERMLVIIANETSVPKEDRDPKLYENIKNNDMNYILHQAMNALRTLRDNNLHFTHPDDYKDVVNKMKFSDSTIRQFIDEMWTPMSRDSGDEAIQKHFLITKDGKEIVTKASMQEFYELYQEYCERSGNKKMSRATFTNELAGIGFIGKQKRYVEQGTTKEINKKVYYQKLNPDNLFKGENDLYIFEGDILN